jgi:hypothetical protein
VVAIFASTSATRMSAVFSAPQFARHETVGRIGGVIWQARSAMARRQVAQQRGPNLVLSVGGLGFSVPPRSLRLDNLKQGRVASSTAAAEGDAARLAGVEPATMAGIAGMLCRVR